MIFGYLLATILTFADFLSESIHIKARKSQLVAFAAGLSVTYIFLILLPEVYTSDLIKTNKFILLSTLFGFSIYHIADKYVHHTFTGVTYRKIHSRLHANMAFLTSVIVGFLLVTYSEKGISEGLILFIPLFFHIIIDALPKHMSKGIFTRLFYSLAPIFGALIASFSVSNEIIEIILLSFIGGAISYAILRDDLPESDKDKPYFFILGMIFFLIIVIIFWNFI
ncbi:MAG: hypothetical protein ACMXYG_07405 [Candidatus Woesearchaeota archaeon]